MTKIERLRMLAMNHSRILPVFPIALLWVVLAPRIIPDITGSASDRSVFVSVAERLKASDVLYSEVWDNKDPLFYYTITIGRALSPYLVRSIGDVLDRSFDDGCDANRSSPQMRAQCRAFCCIGDDSNCPNGRLLLRGIQPPSWCLTMSPCYCRRDQLSLREGGHAAWPSCIHEDHYDAPSDTLCPGDLRSALCVTIFAD